MDLSRSAKIAIIELRDAGLLSDNISEITRFHDAVQKELNRLFDQIDTSLPLHLFPSPDEVALEAIENVKNSYLVAAGRPDGATIN